VSRFTSPLRPCFVRLWGSEQRQQERACDYDRDGNGGGGSDAEMMMLLMMVQWQMVGSTNDRRRISALAAVLAVTGRWEGVTAALVKQGHFS
jgi:hypothetical protein